MSAVQAVTDVKVIRHLEPFGVEVEFDLSSPITPAAAERLSELFDRHHLLLFRNQDVTIEQQRGLMSVIGPVLQDEVDKNADFISTEPTLGALGITPLAYHSDLSCTPDPLIALTLYATDVVDGETSTRFPSNIAAAAALPPDLRERIADLQAAHYWPKDVAYGLQARSEDVHEGWQGAVHPVLMPHPRTGDPVLFVTKVHTHHIINMDPDESRSLIEELEAYVYDDARVYEHAWNKGDLVLWDNVALQHGRPPLEGKGTRTLQRVVAGAPFAHLIPPEVIQYYISG
jgi:taurine dioxygenase